MDWLGFVSIGRVGLQLKLVLDTVFASDGSEITSWLRRAVNLLL